MQQDLNPILLIKAHLNWAEAKGPQNHNQTQIEKPEFRPQVI